MLSRMMHTWSDKQEQQTSVQADVVSRARSGRRLVGLGACLGAALAMVGAPSVEATPLMHWTWEGIGDTPEPVDGNKDYWWVDKINGIEMRLPSDDKPVRHELPETGAGSRFTEFSMTGSEFGITNPNDFSRTPFPQPLLERSISTTEIFFNPAAAAIESDYQGGRLVRIMGGKTQMQLSVSDGTILANLYYEDVDGNWGSSMYNPSFSVEADKDYYAAFAISTGESADDRFIDFYLADLTAEAPVLQHERVAIGDQFTALRYHSNTTFRVGEGDHFNMIGEVRYSDGVLDQGDLMVIPEPAAATLLLGTLPFVLFARRSRQARHRGA